MRTLAITTRNAQFQQWRALMDNRATRQRLGVFLVQGVRPIDEARQHGWDLRALLHRPGALSSWAAQLIGEAGATEVYELATDLMIELGERDDGPPELVAVVGLRSDDLARITPRTDPALVVIFDRPGNPGNLGSLIRSADALGADGVIVTGHACDVYDPRTVRASRGSLFAVPTVRAERPQRVLDWLATQHPPLAVVGTSEDGAVDLWSQDFSAPTALVVGNETTGMSRTWAGACSTVVRIPMQGAASSLNVTVSGSIALYEARRQRARSRGFETGPAEGQHDR